MDFYLLTLIFFFFFLDIVDLGENDLTFSLSLTYTHPNYEINPKLK